MGEWRPAFRKSRSEQVIISWLCIGNTRLTHPFILKQEQQSQCLICKMPCTIKHVLIECGSFALIRKRFFKVNSLSDLFQNVIMDDFLSFLRETGLYQRICIEIVHKQMSSCSSKMLSTKYSFRNLRFDICKNRIWH